MKGNNAQKYMCMRLKSIILTGSMASSSENIIHHKASTMQVPLGYSCNESMVTLHTCSTNFINLTTINDVELKKLTTFNTTSA